MKLTADQIAFIKDQRMILVKFFEGRIEDLKNEMIIEPTSTERDKIIEAIKENKRWLIEVEEKVEDRSVKKDTGV